MNYTLFMHAMKHDYVRARPLYIALMEYMSARGPDNTVVLFAFALFLAATLEEDWSVSDVCVCGPCGAHPQLCPGPCSIPLLAPPLWGMSCHLLSFHSPS